MLSCVPLSIYIYPSFKIYSKQYKKKICYDIFCFCVILPSFSFHCSRHKGSWWIRALLSCRHKTDESHFSYIVHLSVKNRGFGCAQYDLLLNCKKLFRLLWMYIKSTVPFQMEKNMKINQRGVKISRESNYKKKMCLHSSASQLSPCWNEDNYWQ